MWFSSESRQVARHFHVEQVLSHQNVRDRDASRTSGFGSADLSHSHHERHTSEETGAGRRQRNQRLKPSSPLRNHGDATTPTAHKGKKELVIFDSGMGALEAPLCISRDLLAPSDYSQLFLFGFADAFARRRRGGKPSRRRPSTARGDRQGCTECRRFPLRASTIVHHDQCRPEVAVA